jgi:hypothetical protein
MTAKKVEISSRLKVSGIFEQTEALFENEVNSDSTILDKSPEAKKSFRGLIDQVLQFVSVGGDFV